MGAGFEHFYHRSGGCTQVRFGRHVALWVISGINGKPAAVQGSSTGCGGSIVHVVEN
jgi:uncharacterized Zn-binding protein involved in type VI secretion